MGRKKSPLVYNPLCQNFKTLKFLYYLDFHHVHPMNMYFHRRGHVFVVHKVWNQLYDFMHSILLLLKFKWSLNIWYSDSLSTHWVYCKLNMKFEKSLYKENGWKVCFKLACCSNFQNIFTLKLW
jgi:hypothetical protein